MVGGFNCGGSSSAAAIAEALKVNVYGEGMDTLVLAHGFGFHPLIRNVFVPSNRCRIKVGNEA